MMVPDGWFVEQIKNLTTKVGSGVTPRGGSNAYKTSGIPLIRSQNVLWGKLDLDDVAHIDLTQHQKMKGSIVFNNDVLLNITGASIGRVSLSHLEEANVNQHVCIIRTNKKIEPEYLKDFLLSINGQKQIEQCQAGGNRQGLNFEQIKSFKLPVPPLPEQRKIAKILSCWDKSIATTEKLIAASKKQKKALMQQLLTGKKRFAGFEDEWEEIRLGDHINLLSGQAFKSSEFQKNTYYKLLRGINISRGYIRWNDDQTFTLSDASNYQKFLLKINDIVISMDGSLVGRNYALIDKSNIEPMLLVQRVARLRCNSTISTEFLLQHIASERFKIYVDSVKTITAIPHISAKDIREFTVLLPSIKEQQKIASVLTAADKEIELLAQKLGHLKNEKKALMQQLLTGKRRVSSL